jgi:hypothetical protein
MVRPIPGKVKERLYFAASRGSSRLRRATQQTDTLASSHSGPAVAIWRIGESVAAEPSLDLGDGDPRVLQRGAPAYDVEAEAGTGDVDGAEESRRSAPRIGTDTLARPSSSSSTITE